MKVNKAKKNGNAVRREWTKADVKELKAHSKAKTPVAKYLKRQNAQLVRYARRHCISGSDSGTSGKSDGMYRMDLARVYDLRDLKDHPSSPDAYFRNFEASLSDVPQKPQIHGFSTVSTSPARYNGGVRPDPVG